MNFVVSVRWNSRVLLREHIDESALRLARFVGISVPMHTALRLGVRVAELIRTVNPVCHICFYGLI